MNLLNTHVCVTKSKEVWVIALIPLLIGGLSFSHAPLPSSPRQTSKRKTPRSLACLREYLSTGSGFLRKPTGTGENVFPRIPTGSLGMKRKLFSTNTYRYLVGSCERLG